jgi:carbamoyltransferase
MALVSINKNPSDSQLRQFACIFFPLFCAIVGSMLYFKSGQREIAYGLWIAAALVAMIGLAAPKVIKPFFVGSLYATFPIGWVVSHLLLLVAFYLILTPIGLLMRLFGYDPMARKPDRATNSYWISRAPVINSKRYFKQY